VLFMLKRETRLCYLTLSQQGRVSCDVKYESVKYSLRDKSVFSEYSAVTFSTYSFFLSRLDLCLLFRLLESQSKWRLRL